MYLISFPFLSEATRARGLSSRSKNVRNIFHALYISHIILLICKWIFTTLYSGPLLTVSASYLYFHNYIFRHVAAFFLRFNSSQISLTLISYRVFIPWMLKRASLFRDCISLVPVSFERERERLRNRSLCLIIQLCVLRPEDFSLRVSRRVDRWLVRVLICCRCTQKRSCSRRLSSSMV